MAAWGHLRSSFASSPRVGNHVFARVQWVVISLDAYEVCSLVRAAGAFINQFVGVFADRPTDRGHGFVRVVVSDDRTRSDVILHPIYQRTEEIVAIDQRRIGLSRVAAAVTVPGIREEPIEHQGLFQSAHYVLDAIVVIVAAAREDEEVSKTVIKDHLATVISEGP